MPHAILLNLQCFDTVDWLTRRAHGLKRSRFQQSLEVLFSETFGHPAYPEVVSWKNKPVKQKKFDGRSIYCQI